MDQEVHGSNITHCIVSLDKELYLKDIIYSTEEPVLKQTSLTFNYEYGLCLVSPASRVISQAFVSTIV